MLFHALSAVLLAAGAVAHNAMAPENATVAAAVAANEAGPYWHSFINDTIANATLWPKVTTIDFNKVSFAGWRSNEVRGVSHQLMSNLTQGCCIVRQPHGRGAQGDRGRLPRSQ